MNKIVSTIIFFSLAATAQAQTAGEATIRLTGTTLMHEMRATPSPLDGAEISDRAVSFQWPLPAGLNILRSGLDGAEENTPKKETDKSKLRYFLRYSQTPAFKPEGDRTSRDALAVLQPQTGFGSGHMVLAIRLYHGRKDRMERYAAIYGKEQSPGNSARPHWMPYLRTCLPTTPAYARQGRMGRFHKAQRGQN